MTSLLIAQQSPPSILPPHKHILLTLSIFHFMYSVLYMLLLIQLQISCQLHFDFLFCSWLVVFTYSSSCTYLLFNDLSCHCGHSCLHNQSVRLHTQSANVQFFFLSMVLICLPSHICFLERSDHPLLQYTLCLFFL